MAIAYTKLSLASSLALLNPYCTVSLSSIVLLFLHLSLLFVRVVEQQYLCYLWAVGFFVSAGSRARAGVMRTDARAWEEPAAL